MWTRSICQHTDCVTMSYFMSIQIGIINIKSEKCIQCNFLIRFLVLLSFIFIIKLMATIMAILANGNSGINQ